jgi:hypothetical protein
LIFSDEKYQSFKDNATEKIDLVKRHPAVSRLGDPFTTEQILGTWSNFPLTEQLRT